MLDKKIEKLLIKYLHKSSSKSDLNLLNKWLQDSTNKLKFRELIKIHFISLLAMNNPNSEKIKERLKKEMKDDKNPFKKIKLKNFLKYAAILIFMLTIGYFYQQGYFANSQNNIAFPNEDVITLEMQNGEMKIISESETMEIVNSEGEAIGKQQGNRLIYTNPEEHTDKLVYNQLTVPYGKRFELEFSDGTVAHLNAGSSLKYPVKFLEGQEREVFLVGEAYLNVAKDEQRPFIVNTSNELNVRVLGTQFNVSNYSEDETTEVVLVEGSVGLQVKGEDKDVILEPGIKGSFDRTEKNISTKPVITSIHTSWIKGNLIFRNMTFENILKKLERHYNVKITNQNLKYSQTLFNANFGDEPINKVLEYFKYKYNIDYYTINNNEVIVK